MDIKLLDLKRNYESIKEDVDKKIREVLDSTQYILGENVKQFEKEFAEYIGVKHAVSVGNGTDALIIALKALGIGHGDEVITTPLVFLQHLKRYLMLELNQYLWMLKEKATILIQRKLSRLLQRILKPFYQFIFLVDLVRLIGFLKLQKNIIYM